MAETTIPQRTTRIQRGLALYRERAGEIVRTTAHTYRVPSCSGRDSYLVRLDGRGLCSCPDHPRAKAAGEPCKHRIAATIAAAKARARRAARRRKAA